MNTDNKKKITELLSTLDTLNALLPQYGGKTLENIIQGIKARIQILAERSEL